MPGSDAASAGISRHVLSVLPIAGFYTRTRSGGSVLNGNHHNRGVVFPAGVVRGAHKATAGLLRIRKRFQKTLLDGGVRDHAAHTVRAEQQRVIRLDVELDDVDGQFVVAGKGTRE